MKGMAFLFLIAPTLTFGQLTKQDSLWLPLNFLLGTWTGTSEGQPGIGKYERSYQFTLSNKFIEVRNKSIYPPSKNHPNGEVHEDRGFISYDQGRKTFVLRQFHVEGFVNQFIIESISADGKTVVFMTESIENIPSGYRAKETYKVVNQNEFTEIFELAEPGKDFEIYSKAILKRIK